MGLHEVLVFGAGFGCGVVWLGFALLLGYRLRNQQGGPEPANDPSPTDPRPHHESPSGGRSGSETILVVQDDSGFRAVVHRILAAHGYTVLGAAGPIEAIELSAQHAGPIHLLLTDVVLPESCGPRVADLLLKERPGLSVLFMSSCTDAIKDGWFGTDAEFVEKPFTSKVLLRTARQALERGGGGPCRRHVAPQDVSDRGPERSRAL